MVKTANKSWACCSFNPVSESIEMAGYEDKGFSEPALNALASIVAYRLHANNLAPRFAEKGIGDGFCRHLDLGREGGGHIDWTQSDDVWNAFVKRVQYVYAQPTPDSWPIAGHPMPPSMPPGFTPSNGGRSDEPVGSLAWCQQRLNALHATVMPIDVDGLDGPQTEHAVALFQQTHGLHIDGIIGPKTIAALEAA